MAYATVDDLQRGWRDLTPEERKLAEALLERASLIMDEVSPDISKVKESVLNMVACEMVQDAMAPNGADAYGQADMPTYDQFAPYQPARKLWPSKVHRKLLGVRQRAKFVEA